MTDIDVASRRGDASDAELISRVRGGDVSAYGDLFARHRDAANRLARQLVPQSDADDLVSEGFAKVLNVLLGGGGPDIAFRAYLLTAIRRLHVDKIRATTRATPTDDLTPYDDGEPFSDTVITGFEGTAAAKAFASLPERWQLVLWHLEVEGQKPADVAPLLGMSANAVSALAYRAREGLRQSYLQMHSADLGGDECRWTHDRLGAYVRKGLSRRDSNKVESHLETCLTCTAAYVELAEVNSSLARVLGPLILGAASAGYLSASAAGGNVVVLAALSRAKDFVSSNGAVAAGAAGVVGVAGATAMAVALTNGGGAADKVAADPSGPTITQPAAPGSTPTASVTPAAKPSAPAAPTPTSPSSPVTTFAAPVAHSNPATKPTAKPAKPAPVVAATPGAGTPSTKPTPSTPPTPTNPPTTPPTTPPAPVLRADVSAQLTFKAGRGVLEQGDDGVGHLTAVISGIPAGKTSVVTISVVGGILKQVGDGCTTSGSTARCVVSAGDRSLTFKVSGLPVSASILARAPQGYVDTNPTNNGDLILLGLQ